MQNSRPLQPSADRIGQGSVPSADEWKAEHLELIQQTLEKEHYSPEFANTSLFSLCLQNFIDQSPHSVHQVEWLTLNAIHMLMWMRQDQYPALETFYHRIQDPYLAKHPHARLHDGTTSPSTAECPKNSVVWNVEPAADIQQAVNQILAQETSPSQPSQQSNTSRSYPSKEEKRRASLLMILIGVGLAMLFLSLHALMHQHPALSCAFGAGSLLAFGITLKRYR